MPTRSVDVNGRPIRLAEPVDPAPLLAAPLVGRTHELSMVTTAWTSCGGRTLREARSPLLVGPAGSGKNMIVYEAARLTGRELYILNGHESLQATDLMLAPLPPTEARRGVLELKASALLTAVISGGIAFIDEIGKLRPSALAPLAPLLDGRGYLDENTLLFQRFDASPDFRLIAATNEEDMWTERFDQYLRGRLRPEIRVGPASADDIRAILEQNFELDGKRGAGLVRAWWMLWEKHRPDSLPTPRDAVAVFATAERVAARERLAATGEAFALELRGEIVIERRHLEGAFQALFSDSSVAIEP